jgi:hypothetical protein
VQILRAVAPRRGWVLDLLEHAGDVVLDEIERRHDFGDTLAGKILEIAGLEDLDHEFLDVLGEALLELAAERGREVVRHLIDLLRRRQDLLRRLFGAVDHLFELVGDARHRRHGGVRPGGAGGRGLAADRAGNQIELGGESRVGAVACRAGAVR